MTRQITVFLVDDHEMVRLGLRQLLAEGTDKRSAIARVAADLDVPKRLVYQVATTLDRKP